MKFFSKIIVITGPTATGKTALAVALARKFNGEIVSVDSRQLYRGMDLGSGKDLAEYGEIPCHLVDVAEPGEPLDLFTFVRLAQAAIADIVRRGKLPVLCGGSTLYLDALLRDYRLPGAAPDAEVRRRLDAMSLEELNKLLDELNPPNLAQFQERANRTRVRRAIELATSGGELPELSRGAPVRPNTLILGVYYPRAEVRERIARRLDARLAAGMVDEVRRLLASGVPEETLLRYGLEYRWVTELVTGRIDYATMREQLYIKICQFVKRQDIWFRKMEREAMDIYWLERGDPALAAQYCTDFLNDRPLPAINFRMSETYYNTKNSLTEKK